MGLLIKNKYTLIIVLFFTFFLNFSCENQKIEIKKVNSIDEAKTYAVGTWQFVEVGMPMWHKYILYQDGTFNSFKAFPKDGAWSENIKNKKGKWKIGEDRHKDDGKKYYYIEISSDDILQRTYGYQFEFINSEELYSDAKKLNIFIGGYVLVDGKGIKSDKSPWD